MLAKSKILSIIIISIVFFVNITYAQEKPVIKNPDKIEVINGVRYYIHIVQAKQTVYSIAQAYFVTVEDIEKTNPEAKRGIHPNQLLKIPVIEHKEKRLEEVVNDSNYIYHQIK